jgi:hypothetical protein
VVWTPGGQKLGCEKQVVNQKVKRTESSNSKHRNASNAYLGSVVEVTQGTNASSVNMMHMVFWTSFFCPPGELWVVDALSYGSI